MLMDEYNDSSASFVRTLCTGYMCSTAFDDSFTVSWERLPEGARKRWVQAVVDLFALVKNEQTDDQIATYIDLNVSEQVHHTGQLVQQVRAAYALCTDVKAFVEWFRGGSAVLHATHD